MQISLRSQMIAGTAAIVGASAIAMTPVVAQQHALPNIQVPSASQAVALAGFDSPISELLSSLNVANQWIFNPSSSLALIGNFTNFTAPGPTLTALGFQNFGLISQIITDRLPIITQLGKNGNGYLWSTANAVAQIGLDLSEGAWNALGDVLSLDIPGAFNTLLTAVQDAGQTALDAGNYVLQNVVKKAGALISAVPDLLKLVIGSAIGQVTVVAGAAVKYVTDVVDAIQTLDAETIWNTVVDGAFGPKGFPGLITSLTIGAGVQTDPMDPTSVVPSVRSVVQKAVKGVALALSVTAAPLPVPPPTAAVAAKPVAAKSVAATLAAEEAPAVEAPSTTAGDNGATAGDDNGGGSSSGGSHSGGSHSKGTGGSRANR